MWKIRHIVIVRVQDNTVKGGYLKRKMEAGWSLNLLIFTTRTKALGLLCGLVQTPWSHRVPLFPARHSKSFTADNVFVVGMASPTVFVRYCLYQTTPLLETHHQSCLWWKQKWKLHVIWEVFTEQWLSGHFMRWSIEVSCQRSHRTPRMTGVLAHVEPFIKQIQLWDVTVMSTFFKYKLLISFSHVIIKKISSFYLFFLL